METNVFVDKSIKPDDRSLANVLGAKVTFWEEIKKHIAQEYGDATEEWKFYNFKSGWRFCCRNAIYFFSRRCTECSS